MKRKNIAYYTPDRVTLSLRDLCFYKGKSIEDLFSAVDESDTFDELTDKLRAIITNSFVEDFVASNHIRYMVIDIYGNKSYLKFDIET